MHAIPRTPLRTARRCVGGADAIVRRRGMKTRRQRARAGNIAARVHVHAAHPSTCCSRIYWTQPPSEAVAETPSAGSQPYPRAHCLLRLGVRVSQPPSLAQARATGWGPSDMPQGMAAHVPARAAVAAHVPAVPRILDGGTSADAWMMMGRTMDCRSLKGLLCRGAWEWERDGPCQRRGMCHAVSWPWLPSCGALGCAP